tara:strand:- start:881 stop:1090 length:210 start_codon:yes stop_codon:yes gene_type:complete
MQKYKVWTCKIVVPVDAELPDGFDSPPRSAAQAAVEKECEVLGVFSGWGGTLTENEREIVDIVNEIERA